MDVDDYLEGWCNVTVNDIDGCLVFVWPVGERRELYAVLPDGTEYRAMLVGPDDMDEHMEELGALITRCLYQCNIAPFSWSERWDNVPTIYAGMTDEYRTMVRVLARAQVKRIPL